ncbi:unnamed protein product [Closterium sp. NIES-65]|nr:unnamed protein product [Closterium sp. NIES-65]
MVEAPAAKLEADAVIVGASDVNVEAPADDINVEASAAKLEAPAAFNGCIDGSEEEAFLLGVESEEVAPSFLVAEISSGTNFLGVKMGIGRGFCSSGKGWNMEATHVGQPVGKGVFSNQLFGADEEDESCSDFMFDGKGSVNKGIGQGLRSSGTNFLGVKMGIGRGFCSSGKGWNMEATHVGQPVGKGVFSNQLFGADEEDESYSDFMFDGKGSVNKGIGQGLRSSGMGWTMEAKDAGKSLKKNVLSNQLFGDDDEEDESYSGQGFGLGGKGSVCYMNQLCMDDEEEEERSCLAATGISVGIGRFGARRRISGSSSRVTLRRMSATLRHF